MRKFTAKCLLLLSPFLFLQALELFILPIDYFTFHAWTALRIRRFENLIPGEFYPNRSISKVEVGDIAPHSRFAVPKQVAWFTDRYGFRKRNSDVAKYKIVIVGDSHVAGGSLTQDDMLNEVLSRKLNKDVYPYAPSDINQFVHDRRFQQSPPAVVILAFSEGLGRLHSLKAAQPRIFASRSKKMIEEMRDSRIFGSVMVLFDRAYKAAMLNYFRSRIKANLLKYLKNEDVLRGANDEIVQRNGNILFASGSKANLPASSEKLNSWVEILKTYSDYFTQRGIRFIFMPVPNKENIYYDLLAERRKPEFLIHLLQKVEAEGIETVNLQTAFETARNNGIFMYQTDDSHWNRAGVEIAAERIGKKLGNRFSVTN